jgi:hypothetical protein
MAPRNHASTTRKSAAPSSASTRKPVTATAAKVTSTVVASNKTPVGTADVAARAADRTSFDHDRMQFAGGLKAILDGSNRANKRKMDQCIDNVEGYHITHRNDVDNGGYSFLAVSHIMDLIVYPP